VRTTNPSCKRHADEACRKALDCASGEHDVERTCSVAGVEGITRVAGGGTSDRDVVAGEDLFQD
jgi:hypothetical protein